MSRNIEIKAYARDLNILKKRILGLNSDDANNVLILKQEDVFYNLPECSSGKLKLRKTDSSQELIYYDRKECNEPSLSNYRKCLVPAELEDLLKNALGTWGVVKKVRTLIMVGQTRVHLDSVEDLGNFIELEVVLNENQSSDDGKKIALDLMSLLEISENDLISVSYVNMLNEKKNNIK
ncbi:uncharacterized protein LOC126907653 [Daktulosphaira vitifoliae]|uniref:uncharacterized protein LOC126907653 n=1 Tax=Daktulosphaira vitifoliae TaxID=58002 RepID=UPI0021AA8285|nr:uncharacterized protein LOC126907653 [Daktulosphaira vitifoliae]